MDRSIFFIGSGGYPMSYREPEWGVHGRVPYTEQQDRLAFSIVNEPITKVDIISSVIVVRRCFYLTSITLVLLLRLYECYISSVCCQRPYHVESTGSRPITEVKQRRARLVLGWVTAWEHRVLLAFFSSFFPLLKSPLGSQWIQTSFFFFLNIFKGENKNTKKRMIFFFFFFFKRVIWCSHSLPFRVQLVLLATFLSFLLTFVFLAAPLLIWAPQSWLMHDDQLSLLKKKIKKKFLLRLKINRKKSFTEININR